MKKKDVEVGAVYWVRVSDEMIDVRITGESDYGGWDGVNLATKHKIRIKTAARLQGPLKQNRRC